MARKVLRKTKKASRGKKSGKAMLGGSNLPAPYFAAAGLTQPDAAAGKSILTIQPNGAVIRSELPVQNYKPVQGGFVPSVGEPFVSAAAQYITPLALFAGYKLMQRGKKTTRRGSKKTIRRRR